MKKSNPNPKKYLSDGTEAKVNMLVNYLGIRICKIIALRGGAISGDMTIDYAEGNGYKGKYVTASCACRKATPEERKEYYKQLQAATV